MSWFEWFSVALVILGGSWYVLKKLGNQFVSDVFDKRFPNAIQPLVTEIHSLKETIERHEERQWDAITATQRGLADVRVDMASWRRNGRMEDE